jgi:hypothetical protein
MDNSPFGRFLHAVMLRLRHFHTLLPRAFTDIFLRARCSLETIICQTDLVGSLGDRGLHYYHLVVHLVT